MELSNIILLISLTLTRIITVESNSMKYEMTLMDKLPESVVFKEIDAPNRIHCASLCFKEGTCKGFGYNLKRTCFLMNRRIEEDYCTPENCDEDIGIKLYMVPQVTTTTEEPTTTTTTTKKPTTTTTTTEPTTTTTTKEPTTTTTTKKPTTTTTTEPPTTEKQTTTTTTTKAPTTTTTTTQATTTPDGREKKAFEVKCSTDADFLRGFISKNQFFNEELVSPPTCFPLYPDPYVGGSAKSFEKEPNEEAFCPKHFAITGIEFKTAADYLEKVLFTCKQLKDEVMEKGTVSTEYSADARSVDCGDLNVLAGVKYTQRDGEPIYDLEIKCQKIKAPGVGGIGG